MNVQETGICQHLFNTSIRCVAKTKLQTLNRRECNTIHKYELPANHNCVFGHFSFIFYTISFLKGRVLVPYI